MASIGRASSRPHSPAGVAAVLALVVSVSACGGSSPTGTPGTSASNLNGASNQPSGQSSPASSAAWLDTSKSIEDRVTALLGQMTLDEKIGQMTQIEINSIDPEGVRDGLVGSVLSGGDGNPKGQNDAKNWYEMVAQVQDGALSTRLKIPLLYGVDAIHGDAHLTGTTVFPQNVGMGATHDPDLVKKACAVTAAEMNATGVRWTFGPVVAVPQDVRWGRTYEGFGEQTEFVSQMGTACLQGFQGSKLTDPNTVVADPKHYIGDGGTAYGSSTQTGPNGPYLLDQGVAQLDKATIEKLFLPPYEAAIKNGARIIMATFSGTKDGGKVTGDKYWLTDVLKTRLKFAGFVVSDWGAIDQIDPADYKTSVKQAVNAGVDMAMVPSDWKKFEGALKDLVGSGDVSKDRIDDAVRRILRVKFEMGLFENPMPPEGKWNEVGSEANRAVARQAVAESAVLLKTTEGALPVSSSAARVLLSGQGADDIGMAEGGWTLTWQGKTGNITTGTTIKQALAAKLGDKVQYDKDGNFSGGAKADVGIVVVGERPYSEGVGDSATLALPSDDVALVAKMKPLVNKLIVVVISGRPVMLGDAAGQADAVVVVWQFGTEGAGVADVLLGTRAFTGTTPYTWPKTPNDAPRLGKGACDGAVYPVGYGLDTSGKLLGPAACS